MSTRCDFLISSNPFLKTPHADNQNSRFTVEEIKAVMGLVRPYKKGGIFMDIGFENSMTHPTGSKQSFMIVNYASQHHDGARLAFMVEKTLLENDAPEYLMQFNARTKGYLETTRFQSRNFPLIFSRLQNAIEAHCGMPALGMTLIHNG